MSAQDIVVGLLAGAAGCYLIFGALLDAPWLMNLVKPVLLAEMLGRTAARWALGALGAGIIASGGMIASGWRIHWS